MSEPLPTPNGLSGDPYGLSNGQAIRWGRRSAIALGSAVLHSDPDIEALYDWEAGSKVTLRNLLQRQGYESLDAVREEGEIESLRESIFEVFTVRDLPVSDAVRDAVTACRDRDTLKRWRRPAITAKASDELLPA